MAEQKGLQQVARALESDRDVVVSLDIDNPVKPPTPHMEPHDGSIQGIRDLMDVADQVTFNSGRPVDYQRAMRDRYSEQEPELEEVDLIGGMGTVAEVDGQLYHFGGEVDESLSDFLDVKQNIISVLAENGWKANMQNNRSYDVGVARVEAETGEPHSRGNTVANPLVSDVPTDQLYDRYFEEADGFDHSPDYDREYSGGAGGVRMQLAPDNIDYLTEVARVEEPFVGLRFERDGEDVVFYRDGRDRDVDDRAVRQQLEDAIDGSAADWNVIHHSDGGTEYWKDGIGKEKGLERYLDMKFDEDAVAFHIGDSPSDELDTDRITTIPQYGTELYEMMNPEHEMKPGDVAELSDLMRRAGGY